MKLQMGDIETQAVCYEDGTVAHRRPAISHQPQFSFEQLKKLVRRWNAFEDGGLVEELRTALRPFAKVASMIPEPNDPNSCRWRKFNTKINTLSLEEFRTAEAALAKS